MRADCFCCRHLTRRGNDKGGDAFTPFRTWQPDNRAIINRRVASQRVFNLKGVDVEPAGNDHVLIAPDDVQIPIVINTAQITGVVPSPPDRLCLKLGPVPEPNFANPIVCDDDFANLALGDRLIIAAMQCNPDIRSRFATALYARRRHAFIQVFVGVEDAQRLNRLGHPVLLSQNWPETFQRRFDHRRGGRSRAIVEPNQRRHVRLRVGVERLEQTPQHCRHDQHLGYSLFGNYIQSSLNVEGSGYHVARAPQVTGQQLNARSMGQRTKMQRGIGHPQSVFHSHEVIVELCPQPAPAIDHTLGLAGGARGIGDTLNASHGHRDSGRTVPSGVDQTGIRHRIAALITVADYQQVSTDGTLDFISDSEEGFGHHEHTSTAIIQDIELLGQCMARIERHIGKSSLFDPERADHRMGRVLHQHGDPSAGRQAESD